MNPSTRSPTQTIAARNSPRFHHMLYKFNTQDDYMYWRAWSQNCFWWEYARGDECQPQDSVISWTWNLTLLGEMVKPATPLELAPIHSYIDAFLDALERAEEPEETWE
jgi:hypothetical protein